MCMSNCKGGRPISSEHNTVMLHLQIRQRQHKGKARQRRGRTRTRQDKGKAGKAKLGAVFARRDNMLTTCRTPASTTSGRLASMAMRGSTTRQCSTSARVSTLPTSIPCHINPKLFRNLGSTLSTWAVIKLKPHLLGIRNTRAPH